MSKNSNEELPIHLCEVSVEHKPTRGKSNWKFKLEMVYKKVKRLDNDDEWFKKRIRFELNQKFGLSHTKGNFRILNIINIKQVGTGIYEEL